MSTLYPQPDLSQRICASPDITSSCHMWDKKLILADGAELWIKILDDIDEAQIDNLWDTLYPNEEQKVMMFGKLVDIPRKQLLLGRDYAFAGHNTTKKDIVLPPYLDHLQKRICELCQVQFNGTIVNFYKDGADYIGPHRDKTSKLVDDGSSIASLSLGSSRIFRLTKEQRPHSRRHETILEMELAHGMLILMKGNKFQKVFKHEILKQKDDPSLPAEKRRRISITMREFISTRSD